MSQNLSNSESDVISKALQQPIRCEMHVVSSGLEVTVTPEMPLQSAMPCHGRCEGTTNLEKRVSELEEVLDTVIGIAREALDMVPGNSEMVMTFGAILDSICPKHQDDRQDRIPKGAQDAKQGAAEARRMAKIREGSILRKALVWVWGYVAVLEEALECQIHDAAIRESNANAQISEKDSRIAELETDLKQKARKLVKHENCNNPTRTGTMFAQERRDFLANEREKKLAAASEGTEQGEKDGTPDSPVKTPDPVVCIECGTDKTCDVCKIDADPPSVPETFGLEVKVSESDGQKDKVVGRRSPGHQPGVPGTSHNHKPDHSLAVVFEQKLCGRCLSADVRLKTVYKLVIDVAGGVTTGDGLNATSRILQAIEKIKQEMGAGLDQTQLAALVDQIAEKVIKIISESIVCYIEKITYAECHVCNVRTYPEGTHTIPGSSFGPNIRKIFIDFHKMTTAVRSIKYGANAIVGIVASTGAISKCLRAIAEYAEHGRIREMPPLPDPDELQVPPTGSAPVTVCSDERDVSPDHIRTSLDTPPIITQITDMITMAPYVEFDESSSRVKGKKWEALIVYTSRAIRIKIKPSRSKATIKTEFGWALNRPAGADMYRAGNALKGPFQTCIIHVGRKIEYLAILAKDGSWEYILWIKSGDVFKHIADVNKIIAVLAGGPDKTACDIGVAFRKSPALKEYADATEEWVWKKLDAIAEAYEKVDVKLVEKSRKMAVTIRNALPYTCTSMRHPGMPWHTNDIERCIRQHHVRARNTYRSLPNEQAAKTLGTLQTIHANAQMLGITSGEMISCRNGPRDLYHTGMPPPIFSGGAGVRQDNTAI